MTQPNNPALKEALQNSLAALKMIEGSFFEGSPEQRAIETALHSIEESSALQRETGGEADLIPWNHPLQIGAEEVVKRYNDYAQGHLPSDCNRELSRLIAYFAQQQLSQLRAALDDGKGQSAVSILYQELASLTQQLADAKDWRNEAERKLFECGQSIGQLCQANEALTTERDELKARLEEAEKDKVRLDWLEEQACKSSTGISLDYVPACEGDPRGFRFMRRFHIGQPFKTIREAIETERLAQPNPEK